MTFGFITWKMTGGAPQFTTPYSALWQSYAILAFGLATFYSWIARETTQKATKKTLIEVMYVLNAVSMLTYIIVFMGLVPQLRGQNGEYVELARYATWMYTCPTIIRILGCATKSYEEAKNMTHFSVATVLFGFLSAITREPYSMFLAFFSMMTFAYNIQGFEKMFHEAAKPESGCKMGSFSLRLTRSITLFAWTLFPSVFFLSKFGIINSSLAELLNVVGDISILIFDWLLAAKVLLTLVLVNENIEQSLKERLDEVKNVTDNLEAEIQNTDVLLRKMMPEVALERIKKGEEVGTAKYDNVTLFFSSVILPLLI